MTSKEKLQKLRAKRNTHQRDVTTMTDVELTECAKYIAEQYLPKSDMSKSKTDNGKASTDTSDEEASEESKSTEKPDEDEEECCGYEMPGAKKIKETDK